jgi:hypothetical protein
MDIFILNSDIHSIHTRQGLDLHHPTCKLTKYRRVCPILGLGYLIIYHKILRTCQVRLTSLNMP